MGMSQADNSVKIRQNLSISDSEPDLINVNAYSKFVIYSSYRSETKIWACLGQITP